MLSRPTHVIRWNIICKDYGHKAITYVIAGDTYGRLMGGTPHNELAEFNSWEDPVFHEVAEMVNDLLGRERGTSECFGRVLGVTCDPAPSGNLYSFTGKIWCPICGSPNVDYGPDNPMQVVLINLPLVTHEAWQRLSEAEKRTQLREALAKAKCIPWEAQFEKEGQ